ncbi:hypothetical protein AVEN_138787-2-1, partial [Araneus ventricosus]
AENDLFNAIVMFTSREYRSQEKESAVPFDIGGKQQDLVIANETCAKELASHRGPPQCRGINNCQRSH